MLFRLLALIVLLLFYGIYFTKMLIQKKQGIQTRQIGKRKEKELHRVELWMSAATLLAPAAQLLSIALDWSWLPDAARWAGFDAGLLGDLIFGIAVVTMKNSWRAGIPDGDKTELIQDGIYRWSRNPAFLGFDLMYLGVCLLFCNPATILTALFAAVMLHLQILQEEKYLVSAFGAPYEAYKSRVLRYFGRKSGR